MKWEIEANIGCCDSCRKKMLKYLRLVKGVESVDLYQEISKVVVTGDVDPGILLLNVRKVRKEARMLGEDASEKKLSVVDEHGRPNKEDNSKKKIKPADAVIPVDKEANEEAIVLYNKPPKPSNGRDNLTSESTSISANVSVPGIIGVGASYSSAKIYKR